MVCQAVCFVLCLCLRFYLAWVNRCRDRHHEASEVAGNGDSQMEALMAMMDKTDKEIEGFRYVY